MVARGELNMTALKSLAPVLKPSNLELLDQARFKSKLEIQTLIATHFPQPDVPSTIRKLPTPKQVPASAAALAPASALATADQVQLASSTTHPCRVAKGANAEPGMLPAAQAAHAGTQQLSKHAMTSAPGPVQGETLPADPALVATAPIQCDVWPTDPARAAQAVAPGNPSLSRAADPSAIVPLREGRYKVMFTASRSLVDMFNEAQELFRNQLPTGDLPSIVERALAFLIAERKKQLFAQTSKPRSPRLSKSEATANEAEPTTPAVRAEQQTSNPNSRRSANAFAKPNADDARPTTPAVRAESQPAKSNTRRQRSKPNTRYIAHELRRQVYARDGGRCCFVSPDGMRCAARGNLEFHHIVPFARGGEPTINNICLMCRAHNEKRFGSRVRQALHR
jgi:hypothetical protein